VKRHDLLCFAHLAVQIARKHLPDYGSKFAPKHDRQPSLLARLCLKAYLHLDYRGTEALLASAQPFQEALGLPTVPDHSTLWWFSRHKVRPRLLGVPVNGDRAVVPARDYPSLAHGGRGFHGLCPCPG
jgi:hypothetical protein